MNQTPSTNLPSSPPAGRVLVLAPDEQLAAAVRAALREAAPGAQAEVAHSLQDAQKLVVNLRPDLFVLDVDATSDLGQEFLYDLRTSHPHARAIVLTGVHLATHRAQAAGLGAIHFLEKPFPHGDFVDLVGALLTPGEEDEGEKFQGTLSDLHIADIIQLKCMSGTTSVLEFTGPGGEKARVFFENGQVRHATAPRKEGIAAFNQIVNWKGGMISEVAGAGASPRTIDLDWQILLMEAVRAIDEDASAAAAAAGHAGAPRKILVIDDSLMLLSFVKEILTEANYEVVDAATAEDGLRAAAADTPHLILLDYVLPDMKGDDVLSRLIQEPATSRVPVVYMSGFGTDLPSDSTKSANVIGSLHKPFTSEVLLKTVQDFMPTETGEPGPGSKATEPAPAPSPAFVAPEQGWASMDEPVPAFTPEPEPVASAPPFAEPEIAPLAETAETEDEPKLAMVEASVGGAQEAWWDAPSTPEPWSDAPSEMSISEPETNDFAAPSADSFAAPADNGAEDIAAETGNAFFCGDTSFFSLNWALHTIAEQKLTGTFRCFWNHATVEALSRDGQIILATTRDPELYCAEAPITLVNIDEERTDAARAQQRETGRPLFVTLAQEGLVLREPAMQLVQHYGQKLFAMLWAAPRVRFMFEQSETLPDYAADLPTEGDVDHWALGTLRFIQYIELGNKADYDPASIPAYTRDGFERVQQLRLTVAEAQFASQFNGVRSIAQIAKNLRLDLKFARLTLFRFLALEIVECWPPAAVGVKEEKRGVFGRMFGG
ncbi:MAG: response regulator [Chthoniobacterales bacterium]